ncbi:putative histone methylation protein Dot1 [Aspergillus californicus]
MGVFDHLQKGGAFTLQARKPQIRQVVKTRPAPQRPPAQAPNRQHLVAEPRKKTRDSASRSVSEERDYPASKRRLTPLRNRKRPTPEQRLSSDDDDDDEGNNTDASFDVRKRARIGDSPEPDYERRLRSVKAFSGDETRSLRIVHASRITSVEKRGKFQPAFGDTSKSTNIYLQYPSATPKEEYELVVPRDDNEFQPLEDIAQVIKTVSSVYIPEEKLDEFNNDSTGIIRRLQRATAIKSESNYRQTIEDYNSAINSLRRNGDIAKKLDATYNLSLPHVERILTQIYSRTVSPQVESLRQYENGTDNVYGELLPKFISDIFKDTKLRSNQVFVDLGSGVGNVVLQAALEIGCESWGCEMMQNACDLAKQQQSEFNVRCRLWGIAPGKTHLVQGDFLKEQSIIDVLKRADVILINNQAFTPQLNNELINHFLDMKEGCQIVSLKSFVPKDHKITSRNLNSPINLLTVKSGEYYSKCVSWTDRPGDYFIATKDSSRLQAFAKTLA